MSRLLTLVNLVFGSLLLSCEQAKFISYQMDDGANETFPSPRNWQSCQGTASLGSPSTSRDRLPSEIDHLSEMLLIFLSAGNNCYSVIPSHPENLHCHSTHTQKLHFDELDNWTTHFIIIHHLDPTFLQTLQTLAALPRSFQSSLLKT